MEDEEKLIKEDPNSKKAFDYLVSKGVKDHIAAGIVGNLMQESFQLNNVWAKGEIDDVGSMGIMQWHGDRLKKLYDFQKEKDPNYTNGKPISLFDQLDYVLYEAETGAGDPWMKKQYDKAFKASNSEEAALLFSKNVLRPNSKYAHNDKRIAYANTFGVQTQEDIPYKKSFINPEFREVKLASIDNTDNHIDYRRNKFFEDSLFKNDFKFDPMEEQVAQENSIVQEMPQQAEAVQNDIAPVKQQRQSYTDFIKNYLSNMDTNEKALGGELNSFDTGGTHEENPLGGIPQGIGANGKMNTVEEGETSYDFEEGKYIFSNRIKV